jgi:translation initiation factor 3 subunit B
MVQFQWRPRPPSLLTPEKVDDIAKNLKKYSKIYEQEDQDVHLQVGEEERKRRKQLQDEWEGWVAKWKQLHEEERSIRMELRGGEDSDKEEETEIKEIEAEELVDVTEETVAFDLDQD